MSNTSVKPRKIRVTDVAKDFGVPPKEIADILSRYAEAPRNNQKVLEQRELDIISDVMTSRREVPDIAAAFSRTQRRTDAQKQGQSAPAQTAQVQPAQTAPSAPAQPVAAQSAPAQAAAQSAPAQVAPAQPQRPQNQNGQNQNSQRPQNQNGQRPQGQNGQNQGGQRQFGQNGQSQNGQRPQSQNGQNQNGQRPQSQNGQRPYGQGGQNQNGQRLQSQNGQRQFGQGGQNQNGQRPVGQNGQNQNGQRPVGQNGQNQNGQRPPMQNGQNQNGQRPPMQNGQNQSGQRPLGQNGQSQNGQRPQGQNGQNQGGQNQNRGNQPRQNQNQPRQSQPKPVEQPVSQVDKFRQQQEQAARLREQAAAKQSQPQKPVQQKPKQQTPAFVRPATAESGSVNIVSDIPKQDKNRRYVDTRGGGSSADLSKYDERIDALVPDSAANAGTGKEKIKKAADRKPTVVSSKRRAEEAEKLRKLRAQQEAAKRAPLRVMIPDEISVGELAARLKKTGAEVIKRLMKNGIMASVSQIIDYDTASLVAMEFDAKIEHEVHLTIEEQLIDAHEDKDEELFRRDPVVVVMGHVDHGKTSLLDYIRKTHVTSGEAGGITQHIGAYRVKVGDGKITFLDTPGHAAFTSMRARGAMITDIAVLVVAADDGIMPQTIEAINHAKAAGIPIIVAINKMDKPTANPERIQQQLMEYNLVAEDWGGDTIICKVSAQTGEGVPNLLEMISLTAEMRELKANPNRAASGTVIEAKLDKGRGPVATVLVQNGTLRSGDIIIAGKAVGRIRAMNDETGAKVDEAGPSIPVEVIGLSEAPNAGDQFHVVEDERMARELVEERKQQEKDENNKGHEQKMSLTDLFDQIKEGEMKDLNIIVKGDVQGSVEAVRASLEKLTNEEVRVRVIHGGVGAINESDVMLADASNAIIVGFNVRPDPNARIMAEEKKIDMRMYRVIYECIEEIEAAMKGMLAPTYHEVTLGDAEVRQTFKVSGVGTIAGCMVRNGLIRRSAKVRIVRDGIVIHEGELASLKRFKDDAKEVNAGYECGIGIDKFNDIKEGDVIEAFVMEENAK